MKPQLLEALPDPRWSEREDAKKALNYAINAVNQCNEAVEAEREARQEQETRIAWALHLGVPQAEVARRTGLAPMTIRRIARRQNIAPVPRGKKS